MAFNVSVESRINIPKAMAAVRDDEFWTFAATEWHKLISPYTPMQEGVLFEDVDIRPKEIEYMSPYAHYLYRGELMIDPNTGSSWAKQGVKKVYADVDLKFSTDRHPLASKEWDKAAEPLQKPKLIRVMQGYVDSGRLNI